MSDDDSYTFASQNYLKYLVHQLVTVAKKRGITIIMTAHITKEGILAGPKMIEHLVDVVLYIQGEEHNNIRYLSTSKNRFGKNEEIGFLAMTEIGFSETESIYDIFIENSAPTLGSSLSLYKEGSRNFLIEIQALVVQTKLNIPQRVISGIDHKQAILIISVLEKILKIPFYQYDIFLKAIGGIKLKGNVIDMAICASLLSSFLDKTLIKPTVFCGELGLTGSFLSKGINQENYAFLKNYPIESIVLPENQQDKKEKHIMYIKHPKELIRLFN